MKVVTVTFGGSNREWVGIKSDFLWGLGFPVMSRKIFSFSVAYLVCGFAQPFNKLILTICRKEYEFKFFASKNLDVRF